MAKDIQDWCRSCVECQRSKIGRHIRLPHEHIAIPYRRFENVLIDIVGPLRPSKEFIYLLKAIDRLTRWAEAIPLANTSVETVADVFYSGWIARFGPPAAVT